MTLLLEDTDLDLITENDDADPTKFRHYFRNLDIELNTFEGAPMVALCGYIKSDTPRDYTTFPTCQACVDIYETLKDDHSDE